MTTSNHFGPLALAALVLVLVLAGPAAADAPFTANHGQIYAHLDLGIWTGEDTNDDFNPYGLGLGLGGGYTMDFGLFFGSRFDYFIGDSEGGGAGIESSANIHQFGFELGYDVALSPPFVLRPQIGVAHTTFTQEISGGGLDASDSESELAFVPGVSGLVDMSGWHLRFDLRYNIFSVDTAWVTSTRQGC